LNGAGGTATFDTGFVSTSAFANYESLISVPLTFTGGTGTIVITDADGDTLTMDVTGDWAPGPGSTGIIYFNGLMSNVRFNDNGTNDGTFNGTRAGTSFSIADLTASYTGAIVQLSTRPGAGFFQDSFSNVSTLVTANIVPGPGSMALVGIAGLVGPRRRR
jgi:hypothetical protein